MADIEIRCAQCGKEIVVSEFASAESLICPACGQPMALPERHEPATLTMRTMDRKSKTGLTGAEMDMDVLARAVAAKETESVLGEVHKARTAIKKSTTLWLFIVLLIVGGGLVGWQYAVAKHLGPGALAEWYVIGRSAVVGLSTLLVLIVAFYEHPWQGVFCLLLPFYILYYVIVRMEYNLLRGMYLGVCVAIAAEAYLVPDRSLMLQAQARFNQFTEKGSRLIQRAGEPPGMPPSRRKTRSGKKLKLGAPATPSSPAWLRR
ncbi:MAG: hypothetical protein KJ726_02160 [Verrucomicrobia bacterium]|nr:hypothetical protein [Verrucomicrobiota bacterium]